MHIITQWSHKNMEWFHHLQNILELWFNLIFSLSSWIPQLFILYFFIYIFFLFIECIINTIIKYIVFQIWLNVVTLICLKFSHVVACLSSFFLFFNSMQIYWYAFTIHQLMDIWIIYTFEHDKWGCLKHTYAPFFVEDYFLFILAK